MINGICAKEIIQNRFYWYDDFLGGRQEGAKVPVPRGRVVDELTALVIRKPVGKKKIVKREGNEHFERAMTREGLSISALEPEDWKKYEG